MRLHNLCMDLNLPLPDIVEEDDHDDHAFEGPNNENGRQIRQSLIDLFV